MNIVLDHVFKYLKTKEVNEQSIKKSIIEVLESRRSRFEESLLKFSYTEQRIMIAISRNGPILKPKGVDFLNLCNPMSPTAIYSNIKRLEQNADIYQKKDGYVLSDPLLSLYLSRYR